MIRLNYKANWPMGKQRNRAQKGDHIFIIEDKKNDKISG